MANKTVARNRATSEAQAKPKAYLPRWASRPALENLSRAWTKTAVMRVTARVRKKRATAEMKVEMAAPRRPQQARKPAKKARVSKKRALLLPGAAQTALLS
jgi:hypothetical protein